jgi:hypothetical protein
VSEEDRKEIDQCGRESRVGLCEGRGGDVDQAPRFSVNVETDGGKWGVGEGVVYKSVAINSAMRDGLRVYGGRFVKSRRLY